MLTTILEEIDTMFIQTRSYSVWVAVTYNPYMTRV
jgi:hypothetical protein